MLNLQVLPVAVMMLAMLGMIASADTPSKETTLLDLKGKSVQRREANSSLLGFTSTTLFYTLDDHRVVVVIRIENSKGFPVSGNVYAFAKDVTAEGIAKWVNNQHSDGLFPDVPEPRTTVKLPAEACQSLQSKLLDKKSVNGTAYNHYSVEIKLSEVKVNEQFRLKEHKDTVNVYVVAK